MPCFEHQGGEVHFDIRGSGDDLLFMHGLAADRQQGAQALDDLPGYRLITVDMPGHGDSKMPDGRAASGQASFKAYGEVATALLAHLGVRKIIAGGISMGAGIALHLALSSPHLVRALLLVRPAWLDRPGRPHLSIIEDIGSWLSEAGAEYTAARLKVHPVFEAALAENPACAASIMGAVERPQAIKAAAVLGALVADQPFDRISSLAKCTTPALVIGNNADPLHPPMIARELSGALADARYFHAPPKYLAAREHKAAVIKAIEQFLQEQLQPLGERKP
jgi:pimeloyl-ACP methyl ester carboxylesterase